MTRFKGKVFPSFSDQERKPKEVKTWTRHQGTQQQKRHLKQKCRWILDSHDANVIYAGLRVMEAVKGEPDPEFSSLHLMCAGMDEAKERGVSWPEAMLTIMAGFKAREEQTDGEAEERERVESHTSLRRRIGAFFARTFRSRHEATPEGDEHQRTRIADSEQEAGGDRPEPNPGASCARH